SRLRERAEWILAVGGHLGYIPGQTYVNVQKKLLANSEKPAREGTGKHGLLSGLVKCGKCNRGMTHYNYGVKTTWQYYKCRSRESQGPTVCDGQSVKAKLLEQNVVAALRQICADRVYLEGIARKAKRKVKTDTTPLLEEKRFITARLDALSAEQKELVKALGKKTLPLELIEERLIELEKEKISTANHLTELELQLESQDWQQIDMDLVFGNLLRFNEVYDSLDFDGKREFLRSIIKKIILVDDNVTIQIFFLPDFTPDKPPGTKKKPGSGSSSSNSPKDQNPGTFEMNGCFCGHFGSEIECTCTPLQIQRYLGRVSGPLLDRMDLHVEVPRIKLDDLHSGPDGESSTVLRERVIQARDVQQRRYRGSGIFLNSQMGPADLRRYCGLDEASHQLLKASFERLHLSARAYDRILKIARTIADLEPSEQIKMEHIGEALHYRTLDRKYWTS
ncbi:MAG: recombinase zinc beta ribbon domain-containing protein, partial [Syntrophomonadaceae bacterium]